MVGREVFAIYDMWLTGRCLLYMICGWQGGVCFDLMKMDEVVQVNAEDFDCTVQPGVTRVALNTYLRDTGLWFPIGIVFTWYFLIMGVHNYTSSLLCRVYG